MSAERRNADRRVSPAIGEFAIQQMPPLAAEIDRLRAVVSELESDCLTLALRLYGENPNTFAPVTIEVMRRWRPRCAALLMGDANMSAGFGEALALTEKAVS